MKKGKWTKKELAYMAENYDKMTNAELAKVLKKSKQNISLKAHHLGLLKPGHLKESSRPREEVKFREETECMADIICFMHRRGLDICETAKMVRCPVAQAKEILDRSMNNGDYERYKKMENKALLGGTSAIDLAGYVVSLSTPSPDGDTYR